MTVEVPDRDAPPADEVDLAESAYHAGRFDEARERFQRALGAAPDDSTLLGHLGLIEHRLGNHAVGLSLLDRALARDPANVMLAVARAAILQDAGDFDAAIHALEAAIERAPDHVAAWHRLGVCRLGLKQHEAAITAFRRVLDLAPNHDQAHNNLGVCLEALRRTDEALASYTRALGLNPRNFKAQRNSGKLLAEAGAIEAGMAAQRRALAVQPDYALAHNDLGICYERLGDVARSLDAYRRAVALDPANAVVHNNLGNLFFHLHQAEPALEHLRRALELDPELAEAHGNLGAVLARMGELEAAQACYARGFEIAPDTPSALAGYVLGCQKLCDWDRFTALLPPLEALTRTELARGGRTAVAPFASLALPWPAELQAAISRAASDQIEATMREARQALAFDIDRAARLADPGRPLRIGYLSANFRNHALSHLMVPVFGIHDRDRVRIYTYSQGEDDGSDYRRRIEADSDVFRDQRTLSHAEIARQIHADGIDILVELHGHTDQHRLHVCALRPAPINVTYIGFPGCLGARFIDYAVTDAIVTPPSEADLYTEALVLMPDSYYMTDDRQVIDATPVRREECGLPAEGVVYCCFNGAYKIDPVMFERWMSILRAVEGSVLWLWIDAPIVRRNLRQAAEAAGVDGARLVFADHWDKPRHLARLRLADLFLDTRLYNAHTTSCDALWAGVPVLTHPGDTFAGRVGASLLANIDLPELIVRDLDAYVDTAVRLGRDADALARLKVRLADHREVYPLFDTRRWVRSLEHAYRCMWSAYAAGGEVPRVTRVDR